MPDEKGGFAAGWHEKKVPDKFAAHGALMPDGHLIDKPATEPMHFLLEPTERCHDNSSTISCSQHLVDEWHRKISGQAKVRRSRSPSRDGQSPTRQDDTLRTTLSHVARRTNGAQA